MGLHCLPRPTLHLSENLGSYGKLNKTSLSFSKTIPLALSISLQSFILTMYSHTIGKLHFKPVTIR